MKQIAEGSSPNFEEIFSASKKKEPFPGILRIAEVIANEEYIAGFRKNKVKKSNLKEEAEAAGKL